MSRGLLMLGLWVVATSAAAGPSKLACPEVDEGFEGGCLVVPENPIPSSSNRYIRLFYEWYGHPNSDKETIVIVTGGPGGTLKTYIREPVLRELAQSYNVFFYDQRGAGRSSAITAENAAQVDFSFYHTDDHVRDLELLRDRVIRQPKIHLLGHAYGAHLALAYGVKHSGHLLKLMALNGGADGLGFALQARRKTQALDQVLKPLDGARVTAFFEATQAGKTVDSQGQPLVFGDFVVELAGLVSTFEGQTGGGAKLLTDLMKLEANRTAIDAQLAAGVTEGAGPSFRFDAIPEPETNPILNSFVVCHDLLTPDVIAKLSDETTRTFAENSRDQICGNSAVPGENRTFDITGDLKNIHVPVLLVGGTHDPLVPIEVQERDAQALRDAGGTVRLEKFEDVGHQTLSEHPDRIRTVLWGFLSSKN